MCSEEDLEEYGRNVKNESDITQNVLSKRDSHLRRVSFPENDTDLVTGYLEPVDPLRLAINVNKDDLLKAYEFSCHRHNTIPIQSVVDQIKKFNIDNGRTETFHLSSLELTHCGCESLEEIFKRVQFSYIDLIDCGLTCETAFALFEMFEYYESTIHLNISNNANLGVRGWQACARYMKKSNTLEELVSRDIQLEENEAEYLIKALGFNRHLQVLKLENCNLNGNSMRLLVNTLASNMTLKELYLADNKLGITEATLLGTLLKNNRNLQVLDLSNNHIQDTGINHIVLGLCNQKLFGLEMLILWNNYLTSLCSTFIDNLLKGYKGLTILNIGCNNLHDSFVMDIKESLEQNQNLLRLGLQATKLTCKSAINLADALKTNTTIERIDLRENCILIPGLRALSDCLDINKNVIQIDLNEIPSWNDSTEYQILIQEINNKCLSNKTKPSNENEANRLCAPRATSRKISLTCQTLSHEPFVVSPLLTEPKKMSGKLRSPAPSPIPSPVSSPVPTVTTKSRFSVSRVVESECRITQPISRFTVLTVDEPPKSVSSNSGAITIGFDCTATTRSSNSNETIKPMNGYEKQPDGSSATTEPCVVSDRRAPPPNDTNKPLTSLEKLLSLFQAPTNLFSKPNTTVDVSKQKIETVPKQQCDNIKYLPFSNVNVNKNISIPNVSDLPNSNLDAQSIKENISPEHSLTLAASNANTRKFKQHEEKLMNSQSAFDNRDRELKHGGLGLSKVKNESGTETGSVATVSADRIPLCSSSEDSDSCLLAFESSCSSNISVTDSGISDDSVVSYDCSDKNATDVITDASSSNLSNLSPHSDLTNNNRWKSSTVAVTITDPIDTDHN